MPYFTITDFAAGLDLRRTSLTAPAGTLRSLINCHITPGGEIEKRFAFVKLGTLPADSRGLIEVLGKLYTFRPGGASNIPPTDDWSVGTLGLAASTLYEIIDTDIMNGLVFAIVWTDADGTVARFYDGAAVPTARGFSCKTYKNKMYTVSGQFLYFSDAGDPTGWDPDGTLGAGFIDLSAEDSDMAECISLEAYYDKLAVMSKRTTQLWVIDAIEAQNQVAQSLRQAGTIAWRSVLGYGTGDVLYLAPDGIRSLRARNASLAASVSDVGSPLDPVMQALFRQNGEEWLRQTMSLLQPVTGRFWVILQDRVYVLSAYPGPKITAWSMYIPMDADGTPFKITACCTHLNSVIVRDDDNNYYSFGHEGSDPTASYDSSPIEVVFPFHAGESPATTKMFTGIDATVTGTWDVFAAFNPENEAAEDFLGTLSGPSFEQGRFGMSGMSTHLSLRLRHSAPGPASIANLIVHYSVGEAS